MPVPDIFRIAPDFTICEYCGKSYADTAENLHRVLIEKDGERRIFEACVHCIAKAKKDAAYDEYMTNKTFNEKLGRRLKNVDIST
nr:MAG TPA: zinc finger domain protein [Caudoviricetes sp.]